LDDDELSFKAKGILMVILRNKENWRVYPEEIAKRSKDKVSAVRTGLKELEEHQYIRTYKKISKRSDGLQRYRFCADRKISDDIFEQLKQKLDQELAD
jgi:DNA-binding MarR family transcriptional regulator